MDEIIAIQIITKWMDFVRLGSLSGRRTMPDSAVELLQGCTLAIDALGKRIPKPVKYLNRHGNGADLWNEDYFNCPACGRRLRNKKPDPFCPRCGQALTWEVKP